MTQQIRITCDTKHMLEPDKLTPLQGDLKALTAEKYEKLKASLLRFGFAFPEFVWKDKTKHYIVDGHQRIRALTKMSGDGIELEGGQVPIVYVKAKNKKEALALILAATSQYGDLDEDSVFRFAKENALEWADLKPFAEFPSLDMGKLVGWFDGDWGLQGDEEEARTPGALVERFGVPPFTVLDARQGYWQERKRQWLALGIQSYLGRDTAPGSGGGAYVDYKSNPLPVLEKPRKVAPGGSLMPSPGIYRPGGRDRGMAMDGVEGGTTGVSIFDPVLAELMYLWFSPLEGRVLDPFAGGSVRGIVASRLGRRYYGIDLREEQVAENREQAGRLCDRAVPEWIVGDSRDALDEVEGQFDFVFSCPPYGDLEKYSDDPDDLSNMEFDAFMEAYRTIIGKAIGRLSDDRFACVVVGDFRDKKGFYRNFVGETIDAFQKAGAKLYNEAVLVTALGSLPVRASGIFQIKRKLGKTHQNVLIFYKGDDPQQIADSGLYGEIFIPELELAKDADPEVSRETAEAIDATSWPDRFTDGPTPVMKANGVLVKREDMFMIAGVCGGKVRTCWEIASTPGAAGLVTAGSRSSPQVNIVAHIAKRLGIPFRAHVPKGALGAELEAAQAAGAEIIQHKAGYNNVIIARARQDAEEMGYLEIPFGMECAAAVDANRRQVASLGRHKADISRIVIPVGSGMSLAGILHGLAEWGMDDIPVLGITVGADPRKRLDRWAPKGWRERVTLRKAASSYASVVEVWMPVDGEPEVLLDPHYEAKCWEHLEPGDLFWIVGLRQTAQKQMDAAEAVQARPARSNSARKK